MRRFACAGFALVALGFLLGPTSRPTVADEDAEFPKKRMKAIEKGVDWLKKAQSGDGGWTYDSPPNAPFGLNIDMRQGVTGLCCYALLKAGVLPNDPVINKGFDFIHSKAPVKQVYEAGCILLAIEARYNWEPPPVSEDGDDDQGEGTRTKKDPAKQPKKLKPQARDLDLAQQCVDFLIKTQEPEGAWRYQPKSPYAIERNDASNPQYALLGLDAATRLGIKVPSDVFIKSCDYFVSQQENDGPDVAPFAVPGADMSYKELKKVEKEMRDRIRKIESDFKGKKSGDVNKEGHTEEDERRTVEREAAGKIIKTAEKLAKMKARGWSYFVRAQQDGKGGGTQGGGGGGGTQAGAPPVPAWKMQSTGSMTTSGLASLFICKAQLDGNGQFEKALKGPVNKALRDGAAWIAHHYSIKHNPNPTDSDKKGIHHYYYMYGLERGGILGLIPTFGTHDWYAEGSSMFVGEQKADGSWNAGNEGTSGPVPDTAFALLFLARGTTPVVKIPTRTATGPGGKQAQPQPAPREPQPAPKEPEKPGDE